MILSDTLRLALGNLRQSKLRTALTALGVSIGIASLIGMVSLGVGLQDQLLGRFMQSGVFDAITVTRRLSNAGGMFGGRGFGARAGGRGGRAGRVVATPDALPKPAKALDDNAVAELRALPRVLDAYPNVQVVVTMEQERFQAMGTAVGIPMSVRNDSVFRTMTAGAFFTSDTDAACLVSLDMAKRIVTERAEETKGGNGVAAPPTSLVGQTLTIKYSTSDGAKPNDASAPSTVVPGLPAGLAGMAAMAGVTSTLQVREVLRPCRIAGIVERQSGAGTAFGGGGVASVMIPLPQAVEIDRHLVRSIQDLFADPSAPTRTKMYNTLTVKVERAQDTQDVEAQITALGYTAFSLNDALQGAKRAFILIDILLSLIGSIALAVSSLGIVNTMVMSILERTREIGVMKAIGASDADIRRIFLVEASAIGVLGGVAGLALGWLVARGVNIAANIYIVRQGGEAGNLFSFPFWLVGGALAFAWLISLLAGSYPANRAAKLNPIQALRHD